MENQDFRIVHTSSADLRTAAVEATEFPFRVQNVFQGDVVRALVSAPEPDGTHWLVTERFIDGQWHPIGVIRDDDVMDAMRLLESAYDSIHPGTIPWLKQQ